MMAMARKNSSAQAGRVVAGISKSTASSPTKATTTYVIATWYTFLRFSSARKLFSLLKESGMKSCQVSRRREDSDPTS